MASLRKRGQRWQIQVRRLGAQTSSRTFSLKADAERWGREQELNLERRCFSPTARSTYKVSDLLNRYQEQIMPLRRGAIVEASIIGCFLREPWASRQISELHPCDLAEYRDRRLRVAKPATLKRQMGLLYRIMRLAKHEWGIEVPDVLMRPVGLPQIETVHIRRLSAQDEHRLMAEVANCRNQFVLPAVRLALLTGLRRGELLCLEWSDIDFVRRTLSVRKSKSGYPRIIPLSLAAYSTLITSTRSHQRILPITPVALRLAFERARSRANLRHLRFHDLRHEAISRFFEHGLTVPEVQLLSGHRTLSQLMRYSHADWNRLRAALDSTRK